MLRVLEAIWPSPSALPVAAPLKAASEERPAADTKGKQGLNSREEQ